MIDVEKLLNLQEVFNLLCGDIADPGYGYWDETSPEVLAALGDDIDEAAEFITTTSPELKEFLSMFITEIYTKFHTPKMHDALLPLREDAEDWMNDAEVEEDAKG